MWNKWNDYGNQYLKKGSLEKCSWIKNSLLPITGQYGS